MGKKAQNIKLTRCHGGAIIITNYNIKKINGMWPKIKTIDVRFTL